MDVPGIAFATFLVVSPIALAIALYRGGLDPLSKFCGTVLVVSTVLLGIVKIVMYAGRIDGDGPAYWTLNISLSALSSAMLIMLMLSLRKHHRSARQS
jgi:hypothetical protein